MARVPQHRGCEREMEKVARDEGKLPPDIAVAETGIILP